MNENKPSITSMITAYVRAYHSMHSTDKIFDDYLAYSLIPEEIQRIKQFIASTVDGKIYNPRGLHKPLLFLYSDSYLNSDRKSIYSHIYAKKVLMI